MLTREEIDTAWSRALGEAVKEGEQFTRYHFAAIIRAQALEEARQACARISEDKWSLYKGRAPYTGKEPGRADPDTQGQSDGADLCEQAIESLKGQP